MHRRTAFALLFFAFAASPARAQDAAQPPFFVAYVKSKTNRDAIQAAIVAQLARIQTGCRSASFDARFGVAVVQPIAPPSDAASPAPAAGAWIETQSAAACGTTRIHHILNIAKSGAVQRYALAPGATRAGPQLQRDVALSVLAAAGALARECKAPAISDTRYVDEEGPPIADAKAGPNARAWVEEWTVAACGKQVMTPIRFTPDATGTGFAIAMKSVRLVEPPPTAQ